MKRPIARKTNEDNLRAARARIRAARTLLKQAATLLRQSVGLESMSEKTRVLVGDEALWVSEAATALNATANAVSRRITEAEEHLAVQVAKRRAG